MSSHEPNSAGSYYERYWSGSSSAGLFCDTPSWTLENLQWHDAFFGRYVGAQVLDAGAGDGTFLEFVASRHLAIQKSVAVELSEAAIAKGRQARPQLNFIQGECGKMNVPGAGFDTVFLIEVIEHLLDADMALQEFHRVLKPGGYLCITTTDFNWPKKVLIAALAWDRFFHPRSPHIRFFTGRTLRALCEEHGFKRVAYAWNRSYFGLMPKGQMAVFQKQPAG